MSWGEGLAGLHGAQAAVFGETFSYQPRETGAAAFDVVAPYVAPHVEAALGQSQPVTTVEPTLGVRESVLLAGMSRLPLRNDTVTRTKTGEVFRVSSAEPDGRGLVHLFLGKAD